MQVNTIGPYRNPSERYPFFLKVPFCKPQTKSKKLEGQTGSVFAGDRARNSDYALLFEEDMHEPQTVCRMTLNENQVAQYVEAIEENYMFEFFVDHELVVTGFLGKEEFDMSEGHDHGIDEQHLHENSAC